jgi:isopenicillin-N epimerase
MEANPVRFFMETLPPAVDRARKRLASFVGADPAGLVYVPNATAGINAVLRSLEPRLGPGDEVLISDHTYNACRNVAEVATQRSGARLVEVAVPFPTSPDEYAQAMLRRVDETTRLVMIDAVTSPTALVTPFPAIVSALEPAVPVLVDGAHAPGMLPLYLETLGASYVVGNCHKWMCAPKGAGFLYARSDVRPELVPATVSHGWNTESPHGASRYHNLFDWTGTDDPSARLSVPAAIDTVAEMHPEGWPGVMKANHDLIVRGRAIISRALGLDQPIPDDAVGSMAAIPLPGPRGVGISGDLDPLTERLRDEWNIEVPVFSWQDWPQRVLRISAQRYNTEQDYEKLAAALRLELQ